MTTDKVIEMIRGTLQTEAAKHNACMDAGDSVGANMHYGEMAGITSTLMALTYLDDAFTQLWEEAREVRSKAAFYKVREHSSTNQVTAA